MDHSAHPIAHPSRWAQNESGVRCVITTPLRLACVKGGLSPTARSYKRRTLPPANCARRSKNSPEDCFRKTHSQGIIILMKTQVDPSDLSEDVSSAVAQYWRMRQAQLYRQKVDAGIKVHEARLLAALRWMGLLISLAMPSVPRALTITIYSGRKLLSSRDTFVQRKSGT